MSEAPTVQAPPTEAECEEIRRVAGAWEALHDWPDEELPITKDDLDRLQRYC